MNRRSALLAMGTLPLGLHVARKPLPVAAIVTGYHNNSHANVIVGKNLEGWKQDGGPGPVLKLAAMYVDQFPKADMSDALAKKHGFPITETIEEAIGIGYGGLESYGFHALETFQSVMERRKWGALYRP